MQEVVNPKLNHVYEAPKGSKFKIEASGHFFWVRMLNGGVVPDIFEGKKFTSFKKAKAEIDRYFRNNPKPTPRDTVKKD